MNGQQKVISLDRLKQAHKDLGDYATIQSHTQPLPHPPKSTPVYLTSTPSAPV